MSSFLDHLMNRSYARASRLVIPKILKYGCPVKACDPRLISSISGFPETGRAIWLMPVRDGQVAVIECPVDDPSPFTIIDALMSTDLKRWMKVDSPKFHKKAGELGPALNLPTPERSAYKPLLYDFPNSWKRWHGRKGQGMEIHCILSRRPMAKNKSWVGYPAGGAYCTFTSVPGSDNKPASQGCGFVARAAYFDGRLFADGLANTVFPEDADMLSPASLFNFDDDAWNDTVWAQMSRKDILSLLITFTYLMRKQNGYA